MRYACKSTLDLTCIVRLFQNVLKIKIITISENKRKIFNDPIYGFIHLKHDVIYDIIDHPIFQRLRRISQVGLTHYVYPGAVHTRFHHALGTAHLIKRAIESLRLKGVEISVEEEIGAMAAMILHDVGHGPFSHALEGQFVNISHEDLSLAYMHHLNKELNGQLDIAIQIFENKHPRRFLNQLISGQLDMDRMDYLNRDSFFTGVTEGHIGYDRIIEMLNVYDDELVVEEKAIHSIEKFIMARRIMYWQVYLHKTVLSAEQMLIKFFDDLKAKSTFTLRNKFSRPLKYFLEREFDSKEQISPDMLHQYANLDEYDVMSAIKITADSNDKVLSYLAKSLLYRQLFKIVLKRDPFSRDFVNDIRQKVKERLNLNENLASMLIIEGKESNLAYNKKDDEILIMMKNKEIKPFSDVTEFYLDNNDITKYFLCYPKIS